MQKTTILEMNRLTVDEFHEARKIPLIVVLDDVRSLHNVGSVFRTADAFRVAAIYICGITATPDDVKDVDGTVIKECSLKASQEIHKTALGAEESVSWRYFKDAKDAVKALKNDGFTVLAVEQCHGSTMLQEFAPRLQGGDASEQISSSLREGYAVILGNEVKGVHQEVVDMCDGCLEIPQYGTKHSLNVSVTAGIVIWHFAQQLIK
jgi:tRNA G18 (ribose-2'-O)-methylase SpoU